MSLCRIGSLTLWDVAAEIMGGTPFYVAGSLFATKQVHIKHYGLKIGGANFWWDSASFLVSKNPEIHKWGPKIQGRVIPGKKSPCQECTTQKSGVGIVTIIQISRYPDILRAAPCCRRPPFINLQIYGFNYETCVIFELILSLVGYLFVTFFGSGLRFGGEGRPGSEQSARR